MKVIDVKEAVRMAYSKSMITWEQVSAIQANNGNYAQAEDMLFLIRRWICGGTERRLATFTAMLREMNLGALADKFDQGEEYSVTVCVLPLY